MQARARKGHAILRIREFKIRVQCHASVCLRPSWLALQESLRKKKPLESHTTTNCVHNATTEEEGTSIASDVVHVEGEDPATPGSLRFVDTRKPVGRL